MAEYVSKAITTTIKANAKTTIKVRDNFYSIEFTEERTVPEVEGVDIQAERDILFDEVIEEVDYQIQQLFDEVKKSSRK